MAARLVLISQKVSDRRVVGTPTCTFTNSFERHRPMTYQTVQPRILPRRLSDAALGLAIGLVQFFVFLVLMLIPTLAVGILTQNAIAAALTFMALFVFTSILILLFTVRHLRCDAEGLEFVRVLGTPEETLVGRCDIDRGGTAGRGCTARMAMARHPSARGNVKSHLTRPLQDQLAGRYRLFPAKQCSTISLRHTCGNYGGSCPGELARISAKRP